MEPYKITMRLDFRGNRSTFRGRGFPLARFRRGLLLSLLFIINRNIDGPEKSSRNYGTVTLSHNKMLHRFVR